MSAVSVFECVCSFFFVIFFVFLILDCFFANSDLFGLRLEGDQVIGLKKLTCWHANKVLLHSSVSVKKDSDTVWKVRGFYNDR